MLAPDLARGCVVGVQSPRKAASRPALYAGVSAIALFASGALSPAAAASAASMLSPAGLAQAAGQRVANATASVHATATANPSFQAQAALSAANLARAAQALKDTTAAQSAARASSQLTLNNAPLSGSAWNGAVLSGLNPVDDTDETLWINAEPLLKDEAAAKATVKQTSANALLTWQSLDLNKGETLVFDQQGNAEWTVLNRVVAGPRDPVTGSRFVASPSVILGKIEAPGSVYVINPNGVIFGPTAEIHVHSLIASSLDVGSPFMTQQQRDGFFLNTGILGNGTAIPEASFSYDRSDTIIEGDVRVEAGAVIATSLAPRSVSPDAGGFVYLFAPNVENHGTISTPSGQTMMVSAQTVQLIANAYPDGGIPTSSAEARAQTFRGVGVNTRSNESGVTPPPNPWRLEGPIGAQIAAPGNVLNTGLIDAERGLVVLYGDIVTNATADGYVGGIIRTDTSITRNGRVFLTGRQKLTLDAGSSIQILPHEGEETIPLSAVTSFSPGTVSLRGQSIALEAGALIIAPGASVSAIAATSSNVYPQHVTDQLGGGIPRLYAAPQAQIDVSGLNGVTLPMAANLLTFRPFGNEFADQPLQRQGALRGQDLTIDIRESGTYGDADWIGTPLANVVGFVNNIQQTIHRLLTTGGGVSLLVRELGEIVLRQGSVINVGGGSIEYLGGTIETTKLVAADGRIVDIARADPLDTFIGIAGVITEEHPKWGSTATQIFDAPLLAGAQFEPGYTEGRDAGGIALEAGAYVLDGSFYGGAITGERQRLVGNRPSPDTPETIKQRLLGIRPTLEPIDTIARAGFISATGRNNLIIQSEVAPLPDGFALADIVPADRLANTRLSASVLSAGGFGLVSARFAGQLTLTSDSVLKVEDGGTIDLAAGKVDVAGQLIARSGTIAIESTAQIAGDDPSTPQTAYEPARRNRNDLFDLTIAPTAVLDASGLWVNDTGADLDDLFGAAYIDGGAVTLNTRAQSAACVTSSCTGGRLGEGVPAIVDLTGSIILSEGSLLDVSSGGRVTIPGLMQLDGKGREAGSAGDISLQTYIGGFATGGSIRNPPTLESLAATIVLPGSDGTPEGNAEALDQVISAYGLAQGGVLSIQIPAITIGGAASDASGALALPASFFDGNAFTAYRLTSVAGELTVAPGVTVTAKQQNFLAGTELLSLPTGIKLADATGTGYRPEFLRTPVDLALSSNLAPLPSAPYDPETESAPAHVALRIGEGAVIEGDPGAHIAISVSGRVPWAGSANPEGGFVSPIAQQIGVAEILGTIEAPGGAIALAGAVNSTIWLGADAVLDVSGIAVTDTRQPLIRTGTILPGGSVTISTATDINAAVVALNGALIDVSGAAGEFDLMQQNGVLGPQLVAMPVWSDAGSISLTAVTLLFDGSFLAHPGADAANGGRLTIAVPETLPQREVLTVRQTGDAVPAGLTSTDSLDLPIDPPDPPTDPSQPPMVPPAPLRGSVFFKADELTGSGIVDLTLSAGPIQGDRVIADIAQGGFKPGTITFDGDVTIGELESLALDASRLSVVNIVDTGTCNVCLEARYVALRGSGDVSRFMPVAGYGRLRVDGQTIDIAAGGLSSVGGTGLLSLSGFGNSRFVSTGDIRFRVPLANVTKDLAPGTQPFGELITRGDLTFLAQQIYPISSIDFTVKSIAPDATISFGQTGVPDAAPLSAGGQLTVSAAHIEQGGRVLAPLGVIRLGAQSDGDLSGNDPTRSTVVATESVILSSGSITSVSLNGQTVPFGVTANETSWSYNTSTGEPLTAPPAKDLIVNAAAIDFAEGAVIDLSGGGTIYATEFVPGIGGTRNILATENAYAIVPGYDPVVSPIDLDFAIQQGDSHPEGGRSVYLSGGDGLPAGTYTLLPAHYATLPGAYLVSLVPGSTDAVASFNTVLPDGTLRMAGYFAQPAIGTRDPRTQVFNVQSSAVWRQYSEIVQTSANSFFGDKTIGESNLPPQLPADAAHAAFIAVSGLNLEGIIHASPATQGRGARLDIAAQDIQVLSPGGTVTHEGLLPLDATQLSNLGVESLLIGGVRSPGADGGDRITVVANAVRIHNDASAPLEAPEIILVTKSQSGGDDPNAGFDVRLDADSVVRAVGEVADPSPRLITIGDELLDISGSGSLVAVSKGAPLTVIRENAKQANGEITMVGPDAKPGSPGATLEGASLTLDTTGQIRLNTGVTVTGDTISIAAKSISFGEVTDAPGGFIVRGDILKQLEQAQTLTLRSASQTINFYGGVNLVLDRPGSRLVLDTPALVATAPGFVKLGAETVELINSRDAEDSLLDGSAALRVEADEIELGAGDKAFGGFGFVTFAGASGIAVRDTGSISAGSADLRFVTPLFLVGAGADQTVNATNLVTFAGTDVPGTPVSGAEIGGTFEVKAPSIDLAANALIQATAGGVTLQATSRDIHLGENARILATGNVQTFFDVTRVTGGGSVNLIADLGTIQAHAASSIDVSSPAGYTGYAGSIGLTAPNGWIFTNSGAFEMGIIAGSVAGDSGGRLAIQTRHLGTPALSVPSIFSDSVNIHVGRGDLQLATDLAASNVTLTADAGVLTIDRTINASGEKGGTISLFGGLGVVLTETGQLLATASDAEKKGGEIVIGTQMAVANGSTESGLIDLQGGIIDVSNTANAANGGAILLRAPLIGEGEFGDDVAINTIGSEIRGAASFTVEAFKVFDTANSAFNGTIDPIAQPDFYGSCTLTGECAGTLVRFVQDFSLSSEAQAKFSSIAPGILHLQPGIELVNNDPLINNGDITVANAWNLGAGVAGFLQGVVQSRFGGTFQGYLVNAEEYSANKITYPPGTVFTDEFGKLLFEFRNYKHALEFKDGISVTTTVVVTDEFGNLLDQFEKYKGPLVAIDGVSELKRSVVTDQYGTLLPEYSAYEGVVAFVPGVSQITSLAYRVGGEVAGEPGTLTLRAARDVVVNDSITDGFFQTRNSFDDDYQANLSAWISLVYGEGGEGSTNVSNVGGYLIAGATANSPVTAESVTAGPPPVAPYDRGANGISPSFSNKSKIPITGADLFPLIVDPDGPIEGFDGNYRAIESWSYRIVGGADVASANPLALRPLAEFADDIGTPFAGHGNVVLDGHKEYNVVTYILGFPAALVAYRTPTIIRTGTGSIDIAAGRDFILADEKAPGVVYTAGRNSVELPDPGFVLQTFADPFNPGDLVQIPVASNPEGFLKPQVLNCDLHLFSCNPYGPMTQAVYPVDGGDLTLTVQRDIIGFEHPTINTQFFGVGVPYHQYFAPWLLAQGSALPANDFGPFSPLSAFLGTGRIFTPSQTSWWINFGSFGQGLMSVGGDVRIEAGRDIQELAVSLPTTARTSGGLSATIIDANGNQVANIPVLHLNKGGDLTVIAGRDLKSGAYYEGSGQAKIIVGGSVSASWEQRIDIADPAAPAYPISTVLAVDTGSISLIARGTADIAGVVSGASLQNVADLTGAFDVLSQSVSTYGPLSAVSVQSIGGDVIANSLSFGVALIYNAVQSLGSENAQYPGVNEYPASFEAVSLSGDVRIADSLRLAPSNAGTLNLLAYDSLLTSTTSSGGGFQPISAGPSLVLAAFDPLSPLAGFGPAPGSRVQDLGTLLLHTNDTSLDLFYAATGDIVAGLGRPLTVQQVQTAPRPLSWEVNKPAIVRAARDIVDLSFFGQNLAPTDVTQIIAGRDLYYTGTWQYFVADGGITVPGGTTKQLENQGGLSLTGPGFFVVQAGRDLGPFVTAASDIVANARTPGPPGSDTVGTGIITFGNLVVAGNRRMVSDRDYLIPNQFALGANDKLPRQGADIITMFGVGNGGDYQAVIGKYIDPATSTSARNYLPDLAVYLQTLGYAAQSTADAWTTFQSLKPELQHIFVDKVFFSELRIAGDAAGCCFQEFSIGYSMVNTLFPSSLGYSDNGPDETATATLAETGNADLLHSTVKTLQSAPRSVLKSDGKTSEVAVGGDIMILGPGGTINVGTTALEINKHLTNSAVGILTLDNGVINTFTDLSVLVNQSRVLTVQGGDLMMWSSNRDLDAGRGAKTTIDFRPLSVDFAPNDLQTINLNGLVSGAGIGTIQSTPDAPAANAFLIAPRGIVNAGDAGLRSSGNLSIAALLVLNAANIATVGTVSGVPDIGAVNLGALESTAAVGGQAAQAAQDAVAEAANRGGQVAPPVIPSLITVEVFIGCDPDSGMTCPQQ